MSPEIRLETERAIAMALPEIGGLRTTDRTAAAREAVLLFTGVEASVAFAGWSIFELYRFITTGHAALHPFVYLFSVAGGFGMVLTLGGALVNVLRDE